MATETRTIIAGGGGNYTTIQAWEDATNLNSGADIWKGVISDNSAYDEAVTIDQDGTGTSSYVWLTVADANRHAGVAGTGHGRLSYSGTNTAAIQVDADWCRIDWLEINRPASGSIGNSDEGIRVTTGVADVLIDYMIIWTDDDGSNNQTDGIYTGNWPITRLRVSNSVIYGWDRGGIHIQDFSGTNAQTIELDHMSLGPNGENNGSLNLDDSGGGLTCTVYNSWISCADIVGTGSGANILAGDAGITINLNYSTWDFANDSFGSSTVNESNTVDATAEDLTETAPTTAGIYLTDISYPTSFDATPVDHANNVLITNATNRQGSEPDARQDFSVDITGGARPTTSVDIGAFQITTVAGESFPPVRLNMGVRHALTR